MAWADRITRPHTGKELAVWLLSALLAITFIIVGAQKLTGSETFWVEAFAMFGYPTWFRILVGIVEVVGGICLLIPAASLLALPALGIVTFGAAFTHLASGTPGALVPFLLFLALAAVAWLRRDAIREAL
ncbi:MAG: DoxX family protein [Gemmatimonadota bacterium]|nr:DoxX family protein [Gemmatimonadota bacterium]